jgi:predicted transport protein
MNIYNNKSGSFSSIKEKPFKLEKEIQKIFEDNLEEILDLELVQSEFTIQNKRIDTLAYDKQNKAFIIIEYKRDKNSSVVDQGFTYLNLMLENKATFILAYNETLNKTLHSSTIDWSQTRVIFVSTNFTENQKQATNFKDLGIELYEIKRFEGDIIVINPYKKTNSATSIKSITEKNETLKNIAKEIKVYTEDDHTGNKSDEIIELYEVFKNAILNLSDDIEIQPKLDYIAFKKNSNIADICIQKKGLKIWINLKKGQLEDPKNIMRDVSEMGHWGNGDYEIVVTDTENIEYIMSLVKQAIK